MAISFVNAGAIATATSGNVTPALPDGWTANDIFLCAIASVDNVNSTLPAGWTAIDAGTNNGAALRSTLYYRRAVADDTAPLVTHAAGGRISAVVIAYRGMITSDSPIDVLGATHVNAGSSTLTFDDVGITTVVNKDWVIEFGATNNSTTASTYTGDPTPTERVDEPNTLSYPELVIADFLMATAGATGARTCTLSTARTNNGLLVSFKPAPVPDAYVQVVDSLSLVELLALTDRLGVSDSLSLAEIILLPPTILYKLVTDSLALAELLALKGRLVVADSLGLTDIAGLKSRLSLAESLGLSEILGLRAKLRTVDSLYLHGPTMLYENYTTGDNVVSSLYSNRWLGQTFTPQTSHRIASVKLKLCRGGSPGAITVSIRATNVNGYPTGGDLCIGSIDGNTLIVYPSMAWYEITLGDAYLSAGTKYAIVVRAPLGDTDNLVAWANAETGGYPRGCFAYSSTSGSDWTIFETEDFMFEEWGRAELLAIKSFLVVSDSLTLADIPLLRLFKAVSDSLALAEALGLKAQFALLDNLALAEAAVVKGGITVADAIALAEVSNIRAFLAVSESLSLSDIANLRLFKAVADALALSDILGLRAALTVSDALALAEATELRARLVVADSLGLAEILAILNRVGLADAISVAETLGLSIRLTQADSLSLLEVPAIRVSLSVTETLALAEAIASQFCISVQDSLALVDFIEAFRGILVSDRVSLSDAVSVWLKFRYAEYLALPKAAPKKPVFRV